MLNFTLGDEHQMIVEMVRGFAEEVLGPGAEHRDRHKEYPTAELAQAAELGLLGATIPEEWGGAGMDAISYLLINREISRRDAAFCTIMGGNVSLFCEGLRLFGTDAQKEEWLKPCASGQMIGAFATTEPHMGSDLAGMKATYRQSDKGWVLNGQKAYITNAKHGKVMLVFASKDLSLRHKGLSCFIVPTDAPGVEVSEPYDKMGIRSSDTCDVYLTDCEVPTNALLGGTEGEGFKQAIAILSGGRGAIAGQAWGIAQAAFEAAVQYAQERETFGQPIYKHQTIANYLADMQVELTNTELISLRAAWLKANGQDYYQAASMAKLYASEAACRICDLALQIHGGYGYVKEYPVERYYRDARVIRVYEGTSEIQRSIIAGEVIKQHPIGG